VTTATKPSYWRFYFITSQVTDNSLYRHWVVSNTSNCSLTFTISLAITFLAYLYLSSIASVPVSCAWPDSHPMTFSSTQPFSATKNVQL